MGNKQSISIRDYPDLVEPDLFEGALDLEIENRLDPAVNILDQAINRIANEARVFHRRAQNERRFHTVFSAITAILGVAAPAIVTYQTQVDDPLFKLIAILLSAIVGASVALQATFRWSDHYRGTTLTALALDELESTTWLKKQDILDTTDPLKAYQKIYELNEICQKELRSILREHIEAEVAIIAPDRDHRISPEQNANPARSYG